MQQIDVFQFGEALFEGQGIEIGNEIPLQKQFLHFPIAEGAAEVGEAQISAIQRSPPFSATGGRGGMGQGQENPQREKPNHISEGQY